jgi:hypothetical protein
MAVHFRNPPARAKATRPAPNRHRPPVRRWGRVTPYAGGMVVTLGPAEDRRRRRELTFDRVEFGSAGISISNDGGRTFHSVEGKPMGTCGFHWQGYGINAIVATHKCVPSWALGSTGRTAREWLRIENLVPYARVVLVMFSPPVRRRAALLPS